MTLRESCLVDVDLVGVDGNEGKEGQFAICNPRIILDMRAFSIGPSMTGWKTHNRAHGRTQGHYEDQFQKILKKQLRNNLSIIIKKAYRLQNSSCPVTK